ncbi:hypothetical protein SS50377_27818 [Spironucleus salmonicida]|uniref:Uncharacterized protein n=1 Tax=Spironucleus salmonicida TaxID=348837 RepID=V6LW57_9EUKA|nr:hypothetical protein SS50377_27818 [Spironucleus salmonicida]|eukprot:EST48862.1 Hypothetical protein SS50377_10962 [Spironucleus salmonicida]
MTDISSFLFHSIQKDDPPIKVPDLALNSQNNQITLLNQALHELQLSSARTQNVLKQQLEESTLKTEKLTAENATFRQKIVSVSTQSDLLQARVQRLEVLKKDLIDALDGEKATNFRLQNEIENAKMTGRLHSNQALEHIQLLQDKEKKGYAQKICYYQDIINKQEIEFSLMLEEKDVEILNHKAEIAAHKVAGNELLQQVQIQEKFIRTINVDEYDFSAPRDFLQVLTGYQKLVYEISIENEQQQKVIDKLSFQINNINGCFGVVNLPETGQICVNQQIQAMEKCLQEIRERLFLKSVECEKLKKELQSKSIIIEEQHEIVTKFEVENEVMRAMTRGLGKTMGQRVEQ